MCRRPAGKRRGKQEREGGPWSVIPVEGTTLRDGLRGVDDGFEWMCSSKRTHQSGPKRLQGQWVRPRLGSWRWSPLEGMAQELRCPCTAIFKLPDLAELDVSHDDHGWKGTMCVVLSVVRCFEPLVGGLMGWVISRLQGSQAGVRLLSVPIFWRTRRSDPASENT